MFLALLHSKIEHTNVAAQLAIAQRMNYFCNTDIAHLTRIRSSKNVELQWVKPRVPRVEFGSRGIRGRGVAQLLRCDGLERSFNNEFIQCNWLVQADPVVGRVPPQLVPGVRAAHR